VHTAHAGVCQLVRHRTEERLLIGIVGSSDADADADNDDAEEERDEVENDDEDDDDDKGDANVELAAGDLPHTYRMWAARYSTGNVRKAKRFLISRATGSCSGTINAEAEDRGLAVAALS
jgi:hypothetical protein